VTPAGHPPPTPVDGTAGQEVAHPVQSVTVDGGW
jgi:hypothetical protein